MKKIGMIMMLLMGIHLYSQESILPSDIETIKNLELSLKEVETQLNFLILMIWLIKQKAEQKKKRLKR